MRWGCRAALYGLGVLLVAEGIETGLSLLSGITKSRPRIWAALSTSGVAGLILPREPGEMVLAPDGDAAGRKAARKLAIISPRSPLGR